MLEGAVLEGAVLEGAVLEGAVLEGAVLEVQDVSNPAAATDSSAARPALV
ncbi:MAG: pentapeptide repeat-containing protein [Acidimicrobiales bacterium]